MPNLLKSIIRSHVTGITKRGFFALASTVTDLGNRNHELQMQCKSLSRDSLQEWDDHRRTRRLLSEKIATIEKQLSLVPDDKGDGYLTMPEVLSGRLEKIAERLAAPNEQVSLQKK